MTYSAKEVSLVVALLTAATLAGVVTNAMGWSLFCGSLVWIALQSREFRKTLGWATHPLQRPANSLESWFALSYPPFRALQRERMRTRTMAAQLREIVSLAEVIPDGVIVLNALGDIEGMNNAAKKLLELTDADRGLGLATVIRHPDFVRFIRSGSAEEPLEFTSPIDQERNFEVRRIEMDTGRMIVLVRDITTLNRLLTMRQNFVANVSHELRTPLTVVAGYLETMADPAQPDELRLSLIERLDAPVKRMQSLVNDLMLLTQLESTPVEGARHRVNLGQIIAATAVELQGLCTSPDQLKLNIETNHPVLGQERELHSLCVNLLTNALRYSPEGKSIDVHLSDQGDCVRFTVTDHGYGIAPEHLDRLTERFYRVDMAGARTRGGTGLGLAIVKHVLRRHNSELHIKSALGVGSSFSCDLKKATEADKLTDPKET